MNQLARGLPISEAGEASRGIYSGFSFRLENVVITTGFQHLETERYLQPKKAFGEMVLITI
jgi:hypothetical protein